MSSKLLLQIRLVGVSLAALVACGQRTSSKLEPEPLPLRVGQTATPVYQSTLENYYHSADGNDWWPAFDRFIRATEGPASSRLLLSCNKTYRVSQTVALCRPVIVEGCGRSTLLKADQNVTAFAVRSSASCQPLGLSGGGGSRLENLFLDESSPATALGYRFGVLLEAPAHLERLLIRNFSNGIRVEANAATATNAEGWSLSDITVNNSDHAGVLVMGDRASNGLVDKVDCTSDCARADKLNASGQPLYPTSGTTPLFPACAGFIEGTTWGSTWFTAHAANIKDETTGSTTHYFPPARFEGTSRSVCVGCYNELQGVLESSYNFMQLNTTSIGLGGDMNYDGGGVLFIPGGAASTFVVRNLSLQLPVFEPNLGTSETTTVMTFLNQNNTRMRIKRTGTGSVFGQFQNLSSGGAWSWSGSTFQWISN